MATSGKWINSKQKTGIWGFSIEEIKCDSYQIIELCRKIARFAD